MGPLLCAVRRINSAIFGTVSDPKLRAMAESFVKSGIADNKVFVISKSYCPFCVKAKKALKEAGFKDCCIVEIEDRADCDEIQNVCKDITGARSVPRVWINQKFIGGGDEVMAAKKNGSLAKML